MDHQSPIILLIIDFTALVPPATVKGDGDAEDHHHRPAKRIAPPIQQWHGVLTGSEGAFATACFKDAESALHAAIGIQAVCAHGNRETGEKGGGLPGIGIHINEGFLEENVVSGPVVDEAVKMVSGGAQAQIRISQPVYEQVKDVPAMHFEACGIVAGVKGDRFQVYEVDAINPVPSNSKSAAILFIRPVWNASRSGFDKIWNDFLEKKMGLWEERVIQWKIFEDLTVGFSFKDVPTAISTARSLLVFLKEKVGDRAPVQAIIDSAAFSETDPFETKRGVEWGDMRLGDIYLTERSYGGMNPSMVSGAEKDETLGFYRLVSQTTKDTPTDHPFHPGDVIQGEFPPCYYCGDSRHQAWECPSKRLMHLSTEGLERAGYISPKKLLTQFQDHLKELAGGGRVRQKSDSFMTKMGFYDLKRVFQLRFLRAIWGWNDKDWETLKRRKRGRDTTGPLWDALDALRSGNLLKAEKLLNEAPTNEFHKDFRAYCISGFLEMENGNVKLTERHFLSAAERTKTKPQKIFILFQLFRLFDLSGNALKAEKKLEEILWFDPGCPEALYQQAIMEFRRGNATQGLDQMAELIKGVREVYVSALMDPDLREFSAVLRPKLENIMNEAQEAAIQVMVKAKAEVEGLQNLIGSDTQELTKAQDLIEKIDKLSESESYFGYLDIPEVAENEIFSMGQRIISNRKLAVFKGFQGIEKRCVDQLRFADTIWHQLLVGKLRKEIYDIWEDKVEAEKKKDIVSADAFKKMTERINAFNKQLDNTEHRMNTMYSTSRILQFLFLSLKYNLIFQIVNLVIVFVVIPLLGHYASVFDVPGHADLARHIGSVQKWAFFLGGLFWFLISVLMAIKQIIHPKTGRGPLRDKGLKKAKGA